MRCPSGAHLLIWLHSDNELLSTCPSASLRTCRRIRSFRGTLGQRVEWGQYPRQCCGVTVPERV